ncbi:type II toxin-antitoxin system PemK/MazF family toxin [Cryobacterium zhongshanensis]|uniref:Type II toxin-antitoxin system PemK/MazF family toxin n=1 Tax=Cryobacterium zhongshanensis TaxID=2928153 RepID=A0AA41QXS7_9MICO|nr:type II toxin-antitoxin system PemK/MazF family toxin [Cryobacterium zhongshanensis]MCI4659621.1 type II toxin-antitoxin system PemK/MazF family toxin [Cryobacterium zhongshanensis]
MTITAPNPATIIRSPEPPHASARPRITPELRHRRGDIWMVAADPGKPAVGTEIWSDRPAVIVSNNVLNARSGFAQIVYLSTAARKRSGPTHIPVPAPDGKGDAMALCEQIHTVDASRLRRKMGAIPEDRTREIDAALSLSLSIGRNPDTYSAFHKWEEHIKLHGIDMAEEIRALAGQTTDQRVEALTRALELITIERDSYRNLFETSQIRPAAMREVADALETGANA